MDDICLWIKWYFLVNYNLSYLKQPAYLERSYYQQSISEVMYVDNIPGDPV